MKHRTWLRCLGVLVALVVVAGACGSDRKDDNNASGSGSTTTAASSSKGGDQKFGDLDSPCGAGTAKGATDQGVTDDKITIVFGDDAGYPAAPGLNHEMGDAMKAMVKWCNDQGGINGRQVDGVYKDAKLTEVGNVMAESCQAAFFLVGEGWALDSAQEEARQGCNLPAVPGYSVSATFANAPLMYQAVPNPIDKTPVEIAAAMQKLFPDKIKKTAVMFANYAATIDTKDKVLQSYLPFGFQFLDCPQQYNIGGEADWKPFAQKLKDCGAEVVYWTGSPYPNFENYLEAANQVGFKPIYITDANFYDAAFAKWNTNGYADDVYVREAYLPLEQASKEPAIKKYVDIVTGNGGDVNQLGEQATSGFLLWATAAKDCGSTLTRACVLDKLKAITKWTGGGMHAEANPGQNLPPQCGLVLKLDGTKYVQAYPKAQGTYDCDPKYVQTVTGRVVDQAKLGPDRISTAFKK